MSLGATVAIRAKHHTRPFREIEGASEPFLAIFFLLAGYKLDISALLTLGLLGGTYVIAKSLGKITSANLAARWAKASPAIRNNIGWCILPQAGVTLGLALLVSHRLPELGDVVLPLVIATTVIFELFGPLITRWRLRSVGEIPK